MPEPTSMSPLPADSGWTLDVETPADVPAGSVADLGRAYEAVLDRRTESVSSGTTEPTPPTASRRSGAVDSVAPPPLKRIVESLLFVGGPPLTSARACEAVRGLTDAQLGEAMDELNHEYRIQARPYHIESQQQGYVLALRPKFRIVQDRLYGSTREARLSALAIDVLALVAYRQPVSKPEVDALRGAESGGLLRQLLRRGLIAVVQRGNSAQREIAYGTTPRFLELFQLQCLDDLPQTQDLQKL